MAETANFNDAEESARLRRLLNPLRLLTKHASSARYHCQRTHIKPLSRQDLNAETKLYVLYPERRNCRYYALHESKTYHPTNYDSLPVHGVNNANERKMLREAAESYNCCRKFCGVAQAILGPLLEGQTYIHAVEHLYFCPKPKIVLFQWQNGAPQDHWGPAHKNFGIEPRYDHDVLRLVACNGTSYILDLSGAQFGWSEWFWTEADYKRECVRDQTPLWFRAPVQPSRGDRNLAAKALEAYEWVQNDMRRASNCPTLKIQELSEERMLVALREINHEFRVKAHELYWQINMSQDDYLDFMRRQELKCSRY